MSGIVITQRREMRVSSIEMEEDSAIRSGMSATRDAGIASSVSGVIC